MNGCIIFSKAAEWQKAVAELREKKIVQKEDTRHTMDSGVRITYSSNLDAVARAKEKLIESIKTLRLMRLSPLGEILKFIERVESELGVIDFTVLKRAEEEVTERYFDELCQGPEVTIYTTATLYSKANGQIKISKNYDLPQREFKTE